MELLLALFGWDVDPAVVILCCDDDEERELGDDEEGGGLANRTPSYWTPLNSIETTSCWSPLEASPRLISLNCMPMIPFVTVLADAAASCCADSARTGCSLLWLLVLLHPLSNPAALNRSPF